MLKQRILTALVLLALVFIVLFVIPKVMNGSDTIIVISACLLCMAVSFEFTQMYKFHLLPQILLILVLAVILLSLYFMPYDFSQIICIVVILTWCVLAPIILIIQPSQFSQPVISILSIIIFVPAFYALLSLQQLFGSLQLVSILAIAWIADSSAYFIGRQFGKHKIAPTISPGKSIEGALGGVIMVVIYLCIMKYFNLVSYLNSFATACKFALILTLVSIMGDLLESWFKRVAAVKDSGNLLPGHGGIFDRVDSLLAVLAVSFALIRGLV